jgi:NADH:ubiquinone oxidoreductase subunit E
VESRRLKSNSPNAAPAVVDIVREFACDPHRLMDIVLAVQRRFGYVSDDAIHTIAACLGRPAVEIQQTVSFYAFFCPATPLINPTSKE